MFVGGVRLGGWGVVLVVCMCVGVGGVVLCRARGAQVALDHLRGDGEVASSSSEQQG